jgi:hypothetical protein
LSCKKIPVYQEGQGRRVEWRENGRGVEGKESVRKERKRKGMAKKVEAAQVTDQQRVILELNG